MTNDASISDAKAMARRLRTALDERGHDPGHSGALELVARALGVRDWNTLVGGNHSAEKPPGAHDQRVVPLLRMVDWTTTRRFYVDFLRARVDWVDDDGDHTPRSVAVTLPSGARLYLSEHHDDGTPGSALLVQVDDLERELAELTATGYGAPPAIEQSRTGPSITVHDPTGNRIAFVPALVPGHRVPDELPPIVNEIFLPMQPIAAFERFTSFRWWRDYGLEDGGYVSIDDGSVVFHNPDGAFSIGRVLAWEPGARYEQTFTLAQDADHPTALVVTFEAASGGTRVRVEHGGWNASNGARRSRFTDWPLILSRLAE